MLDVCRYDYNNPLYATQCDVVPGTPGGLTNCVNTVTSDPSFTFPNEPDSSAVSNGYAYFTVSSDVAACKISPDGLTNCALACPSGNCGVPTINGGIAVTSDGTTAFLAFYDAVGATSQIVACTIAAGGGTFTACSVVYNFPVFLAVQGMSVLGQFTNFQTPVLFVTVANVINNPYFSMVQAFTMTTATGYTTLTPVPGDLYTYHEVANYDTLYRVAFGAY